jgi:signal transduction histidine kinase
MVRDEIYRIAVEAVRNAQRHAHATAIEVELCYDEQQLHVRVRDNGTGINPAVIPVQGSGGHFGLPGMRERAKLIGGQLHIWSAPASGTEIEVTVPAVRVYAEPPAGILGRIIRLRWATPTDE